MNMVGDLAMGIWRIRNIGHSEAIGIITSKPAFFPYNSSLDYFGEDHGSTRVDLAVLAISCLGSFNPGQGPETHRGMKLFGASSRRRSHPGE